MNTLDFELPKELEASEPPEARGLQRDEVRLMLSYTQDNRIIHSRFKQLPDYLQAGDVLVINTSGTMNAAIHAKRANGSPVELHLSTHLPANLWIVELRQVNTKASEPLFDAKEGEILYLPDGESLRLLTPYDAALRAGMQKVRLWIASLSIREVLPYVEKHGFPIRYSYVNQAWPSSYYQTVYANEMGSAEMPSAGRAFTADLLTKLVAKGVQIAPLILHTGVASFEKDETPYEEYYRVSAATAQIVNTARKAGRRIIATGTTSLRALETVTNAEGISHEGEGWTRLIISPEHRIRSVNAMLTGLHEPRASHLAMLESLAGREHLQKTYEAALNEGYLWHEFGDLHLIFANPQSD